MGNYGRHCSSSTFQVKYIIFSVDVWETFLQAEVRDIFDTKTSRISPKWSCQREWPTLCPNSPCFDCYNNAIFSEFRFVVLSWSVNCNTYSYENMQVAVWRGNIWPHWNNHRNPIPPPPWSCCCQSRYSLSSPLRLPPMMVVTSHVEMRGSVTLVSLRLDMPLELTKKTPTPWPPAVNPRTACTANAQRGTQGPTVKSSL